jgi:hypothetical protein
MGNLVGVARVEFLVLVEDVPTVDRERGGEEGGASKNYVKAL